MTIICLCYFEFVLSQLSMSLTIAHFAAPWLSLICVAFVNLLSHSVCMVRPKLSYSFSTQIIFAILVPFWNAMYISVELNHYFPVQYILKIRTYRTNP